MKIPQTQNLTISRLVAEGILTVRFTWRNQTIRIFGAGYWRKGKKLYEKENKLHQ
jgi:hypothetical protein